MPRAVLLLQADAHQRLVQARPEYEYWLPQWGPLLRAPIHNAADDAAQQARYADEPHRLGHNGLNESHRALEYRLRKGLQEWVTLAQ